jgi:hypothetical protein
VLIATNTLTRMSELSACMCDENLDRPMCPDHEKELQLTSNNGPYPTSSSVCLTLEPAVSPIAMGMAEGRHFFSQLAAIKRRQHAVQSELAAILKEIDRYLAHTDATFNPVKMEDFHTIHQMFIDLNTCVLASAAVERLFSLGRHVFTQFYTHMNNAYEQSSL